MLKKNPNTPADAGKKSRPRAERYKNPARFRLDFIKENTYNRLWSIRMTRGRVIAVSAASVAAMAALIWMVIAYTPMRQLLPGSLRGDLRAQYLETALKLDSLEQATRANEAFLAGIVGVMKGEADSLASRENPQPSSADSLVAPTEAERDFVSRYEDEVRFNLSVLAPIAAEGMVFSSPLGNTAGVEPSASPGIRLKAVGKVAVAAVYRGTVTGVYHDGAEGETVVIQHPNDFISVYAGLSDVFVNKGTRVVAGQRIGHTAPGSTFYFELWHKGAALDPKDYIPL